MGEIQETIEIHASPDDVWQLAGDPGRIGEWLPALAGASLEGDRRACTTQDGGTIEERIVERSDDERYYTYEITESPLPLKSYFSRLGVRGHDDHAHVEWTARFEADAPELEPELTAALGQTYRDGLASLRERLERG